MENGKVKWYDQEKNYGFIVSDSGKEFFVHATDVDSDTPLDKGLRVRFNIGEGKKGPVAKNVRLSDEDEG